MAVVGVFLVAMGVARSHGGTHDFNDWAQRTAKADGMRIVDVARARLALTEEPSAVVARLCPRDDSNVREGAYLIENGDKRRWRINFETDGLTRACPSIRRPPALLTPDRELVHEQGFAHAFSQVKLGLRGEGPVVVTTRSWDARGAEDGIAASSDLRQDWDRLVSRGIRVKSKPASMHRFMIEKRHALSSIEPGAVFSDVSAAIIPVLAVSSEKLPPTYQRVVEGDHWQGPRDAELSVRAIQPGATDIVLQIAVTDDTWVVADGNSKEPDPIADCIEIRSVGADGTPWSIGFIPTIDGGWIQRSGGPAPHDVKGAGSPAHLEIRLPATALDWSLPWVTDAAARDDSEEDDRPREAALTIRFLDVDDVKMGVKTILSTTSAAHPAGAESHGHLVRLPHNARYPSVAQLEAIKMWLGSPR